MKLAVSASSNYLTVHHSDRIYDSVVKLSVLDYCVSSLGCPLDNASFRSAGQGVSIVESDAADIPVLALSPDCALGGQSLAKRPELKVLNASSRERGLIIETDIHNLGLVAPSCGNTNTTLNIIDSYLMIIRDINCCQ